MNMEPNRICCPNCGEENDENNYKCVSCEYILHGQPQAPVIEVTHGMDGLIPSKNMPALVAYYMGVFALIPCFGIFLGAAAVVLGVLGLKLHSEHPEVRGRTHALVGIILGGLCALANVVGIIIAIVANSQ